MQEDKKIFNLANYLIDCPVCRRIAFTSPIGLFEDDGSAQTSKKYGRPLAEEIFDQYLEDVLAEIIG